MSRQKKASEIKVYRIGIIEDDTHKQVWAMKLTLSGLIIASVVLLFAIAMINYCIVAFTPIRTTIPGYPDAASRNMAVQNALRIDSLETIITRWDLYSENLSRIVDGKEPIRLDSLIKSSVKESKGGTDFMKAQDSILRKTVKEAEQFEVAGKPRNLHIEGLHFFTPLKGVVSEAYDPVLHPYVDITAPAGSLVLSVLDGTVVYASWNDETGYVIAIQHSGDILSVYKHNQKLLKKQGDKVSAGYPISLVGSTGTLSTGDHLHFELWYKGEAVDPAQYIGF